MKRPLYLNHALLLSFLLGLMVPLGKPTIATAQSSSPVFSEFQTVSTKGAKAWKYFTIGDSKYLAVANCRSGSIWNVDSKIYKWNGTGFVEFQSIPTNCAFDWEFFTIGTEHYLAVANFYNGSAYNLDSKIYKWNGTGFVEFQSISTSGAADWEFFTIGSDYYLAVANNNSGFGVNLNSKIYKWNGTGFVEFRSISTSGAYDWEFFTIGSESYLAVANNYNGSTFNLDLKIYRWDGVNFVEFQSIPTNGIADSEFFIIGTESYLAVANDYNNSTFNLDSKIYKWNGTSFVEFQSIATNGAVDWEFFTISGEYYLAVANSYRDNPSTYTLNSKIYKWDSGSFAEIQSILTDSSSDWEFFTIGTGYYLATANYYNNSTYEINSPIYKWNGPTGSMLVAAIDNSTIYPGDPISVNLTLQNANDLYAAQASCTVDPTILEPQGGVYGNFFDPVNRLEIPIQVDAASGSWTGAISQRNPAPPLSGNGLFATINYAAQSPGTTSISCDPLISDQDGFTQPVTFTGTDITVLPFAMVNGTAQYQGRTDHSGITITATGPVVRTATTDASGNFTLDLKAGTYTVTASAEGYLTKSTTVTVASGESVTLPATTLQGGDPTGDNVIDIGDAALVGNNFGLTVPPGDARADINGDGVVNVQDLAILGSNYGLTSDQTTW